MKGIKNFNIDICIDYHKSFHFTLGYTYMRKNIISCFRGDHAGRIMDVLACALRN